MTSLVLDRNLKFSINFVTEKGQQYGFPLHWLNYWAFDDGKLRLIFHSHTVELEGIFLEKIITLLEEGTSFKVMQIPKRYIENIDHKEVAIWGINFAINA